VPRDLNKLSAKFVETVTKPGRYADAAAFIFKSAKQAGRHQVLALPLYARGQHLTSDGAGL